MQFTISSACLVLNEQKEMLLKKDPIRGWEIPGGLVEANETFKEAAVREVYEETGIEIVIGSFCGISQEVNKGACHMWWLGQAVGGQLTTSAESEAVGFFPLSTSSNVN